MAVGAVFILASFKYWPTVQYWLGGSSEFTPLVMLAMFLVVIAMAAGLLQLPIIVLRLLMANKQREEAQKQGLKLSIQEMSI